MDYKMKCPYCENVFVITQKQMDWNTRFRCPKCWKLNEGSCRATNDGVLIGITKEEFGKMEAEILLAHKDRGLV